jgi:hypothetical protein
MKQLLSLGLVWLSLNLASARDTATVFQIGNSDGDYSELALVGNHAAFAGQFPHDVDFVVGQSHPKEQWPFIHRQPADAESAVCAGGAVRTETQACFWPRREREELRSWFPSAHRPFEGARPSAGWLRP